MENLRNIINWFKIASFKDFVDIILAFSMLIIAIHTYKIYKEQRDIARYEIEPQFVIDLLNNSNYGIDEKITKLIDEGEIPYQELSVRNMGKFNSEIKVEPYIAVFNIKKTENGDDTTAINIPIKVDRFFLQTNDIKLDENINEIYKEQIYINYMRKLSGAVTIAVNELNSPAVQNYRGGTTVQTEVSFVYYLKISYDLDREKYYYYYKVRPGYGGKQIDASEYENINKLSDCIDMLDFENEIYEIIKTKKWSYGDIWIYKSDIIVNQSTELVKINENCFEYLKVVSCSSNLLFMRWLFGGHTEKRRIVVWTIEVVVLSVRLRYPAKEEFTLFW